MRAVSSKIISRPTTIISHARSDGLAGCRVQPPRAKSSAERGTEDECRSGRWDGEKTKRPAENTAILKVTVLSEAAFLFLSAHSAITCFAAVVFGHLHAAEWPHFLLPRVTLIAAVSVRANYYLQFVFVFLKRTNRYTDVFELRNLNVGRIPWTAFGGHFSLFVRNVSRLTLPAMGPVELSGTDL